MIIPIDLNTNKNKKGIYKDLYREIAFNNQNKNVSSNPLVRTRRGIYANLYRELDANKKILPFCNNDAKDQVSAIQKSFWSSVKTKFNSILSRISYFFSSASSELKMVMLACLIVKKPINNYIENNANVSSQH